MIEVLKKCSLFKNISSEDLELLLNLSKYKLIKFENGEYIKFRGDSHEDMHIIISGIVKTEMLKNSGDSHEIEKISAPSIIAPAFLFNDKNVFPVNVIAENKPEIIIISKQNVIKMLQNNQTFLINYLNMISNKAFFLSQKIWFNFYNKTIKEKLCAYILNNSKNNKFILNVSIENLSDLFGVTRPSLSRTIKELIDEGILERVSRKEFLILDKDRLEN